AGQLPRLGHHHEITTLASKQFDPLRRARHEQGIREPERLRRDVALHGASLTAQREYVHGVAAAAPAIGDGLTDQPSAGSEQDLRQYRVRLVAVAHELKLLLRAEPGHVLGGGTDLDLVAGAQRLLGRAAHARHPSGPSLTTPDGNDVRAISLAKPFVSGGAVHQRRSGWNAQACYLSNLVPLGEFLVREPRHAPRTSRAVHRSTRRKQLRPERHQYRDAEQQHRNTDGGEVEERERLVSRAPQ